MNVSELFDDAAGEIAGVLGEACTYNGTPAVPVVFGAGFQSVSSGEIRVNSTRPEVYVRAADMPEVSPGVRAVPSKGDALHVGGTAYEVATPRPDVERVGFYLTLKKA